MFMNINFLHKSFLNFSIKIHKNRLFFYDDTDHYIEMFDLNSGPASMRRFGPKDFVLVSNLAVYSLDNRDLGIGNFLIFWVL